MAISMGPTNSLTDVPGIRVGHHSAIGDGYLTGVTLVLGELEGFVAGVDVRGGGPGTHETDLLDPINSVQRAHAIMLGGGSSFGLAAASGVQNAMRAESRGLEVLPGIVVPIIPAAIVFDLGRGGVSSATPDASFGERAYADAKSVRGTGRVNCGNVGAGTGAIAGGIRGGIGSASATLTDGTMIAALIVLNSVGSAINSKSGEIYGVARGLDGEFTSVKPPSAEELAKAPTAITLMDEGRMTDALSLNTTIGVIATDATLTKVECKKLAGVGHDGLARAIHPVHTMFDGDTLFGVSTAKRPAPNPAEMHELLTVAADVVSRAVAHALLNAETFSTSEVSIPAYRDLFPSAFAE